MRTYEIKNPTINKKTEKNYHFLNREDGLAWYDCTKILLDAINLGLGPRGRGFKSLSSHSCP